MNSYIGRLQEDTKAKAKDLLTCPLCLTTFKEPRALPCDHAFCQHCLERLFDDLQAQSGTRIGSFECPTCQTLIGLPRGGAAAFPADQRSQQVRQRAIDEMVNNIVRASKNRNNTDVISGQSRPSVAVDSDCADYIDVDILDEGSGELGGSGRSAFYRSAYSSPNLQNRTSRFSRNRPGYSSVRESRLDGGKVVRGGGLSGAGGTGGGGGGVGTGLSRSRSFASAVTTPSTTSRVNSTAYVPRAGTGTTSGAADCERADDDDDVQLRERLAPIIGRHHTGYSSLRERRRRAEFHDPVSQNTEPRPWRSFFTNSQNNNVHNSNTSRDYGHDGEGDPGRETSEEQRAAQDRGDQERRVESLAGGRRSERYEGTFWSGSISDSLHRRESSLELLNADCSGRLGIDRSKEKKKVDNEDEGEESVGRPLTFLRGSSAYSTMPEQQAGQSSTNRRRYWDRTAEREEEEDHVRIKRGTRPSTGSILNSSFFVNPTGSGNISIPPDDARNESTLPTVGGSRLRRTCSLRAPSGKTYMDVVRNSNELDEREEEEQEQDRSSFKLPDSRLRVSTDSLVSSRGLHYSKSTGSALEMLRPRTAASQGQSQDHAVLNNSELEKKTRDVTPPPPLPPPRRKPTLATSLVDETTTKHDFRNSENPPPLPRRMRPSTVVLSMLQTTQTFSSPSLNSSDSTAADQYSRGNVTKVNQSSSSNVVDKSMDETSMEADDPGEFSRTDGFRRSFRSKVFKMKLPKAEVRQRLSPPAMTTNSDAKVDVVPQISAEVSYPHSQKCDVQHASMTSCTSFLHNDVGSTSHLIDGPDDDDDDEIICVVEGVTTDLVECTASGELLEPDDKNVEVMEGEREEEGESEAVGDISDETIDEIFDGCFGDATADDACVTDDVDGVREILTKSNNKEFKPTATGVEEACGQPTTRSRGKTSFFEGRKKPGDGEDRRCRYSDGDRTEGGVTEGGTAILQEMSPDHFVTPTAVVLLAGGSTVVADYGVGCLQYYNADGSFCHKIESIKPFSVAINPAHGHVIVGDRKNRTVCVFDEYGCDVTQWHPGMFQWICGLGVLRNGNLAILDRSKSTIGVYSSSGQLIREFGSYGAGDSQLCMAEFLAVDSEDRIIVADSGNHYVKVFHSDGQLLDKIGCGRGASDGQLQWPRGVCVDHHDNVIVADTCNSRVTMFSRDGSFVQHLVTGVRAPYSVSFRRSPTASDDVIALTTYCPSGPAQYRLYTVPTRA